MRLRKLDLVRYGKFTGRVLDFGEARTDVPDFHLVYGPNEAGKSTLFSAFLDLLFGIEPRSAYGYLHPYPTMRVGGTIETGGRVHEVFRIKRNQNTLIGPDDAPLPDALFSAALGAIDRTTYQMMFSLDDDTIERGGESILKSEGELGSLLFSASSGLPDSSAVLAGLKAQAESFYKPQGRKHKLAELKAELEALKDEKAAADTNAREFASLRKARDQAAERHEQAVAARAEIRVALDAARARLEGLPLLARLRALRSELAAFADLAEPPAAWHQLLPPLMREETEIITRLEQAEADLARKQADMAAIVHDEAVLALATEIHSLERSDLEARHRTAARDMPTRVEERAKVEADIGLRLAEFGRDRNENPSDLLLPPPVTARIRDLAQRHPALAERCEAARHELDRALDESRDAAEAFSALGEGEGDDADPQILLDVLRLLRQDDCLLRQQTAERRVAVLEDDLADQLGALAPFIGNDQQLASLPAPTDGELAEWTREGDALAEQLRRLEERLGEEETQVAGEEAQSAALARSEGFVDDDAAAALRQARDRAWQAHAHSLDDGTARNFETALKSDDAATALRLAQSERVSQARALSLSIADRKGRLSALKARRQALLVEMEVLEGHISAAAERCGLSQATNLSQLEAWLARRKKALEIRAELRAARQEGASARADEERALKRLAETFAAFAAADDLPAKLDEALTHAERRAASIQSRRLSRLAALEAVRRAETASAARKTALAAAEAELTAWTAGWEQTLDQTWLTGGKSTLSPQEATTVLVALQEIDKLLQRKADFDHRIEGMRKDQTAFRGAVEAITARLSMPADDDPLAAFETVRARLAEAERCESLMNLLAREAEARETERQALLEAQARHDAQKCAMLDHFGCATLAEVDAGLDAARTRGRLRERIGETEFDLSTRLGVERAEEAEMVLSAVDDAGLRLEIAALQARHEECDREAGELHAERREAERALSAIGGSDVAAHLEEKRRTVLAEIEARAIAYLRLRAGMLAGETALRLYRERHRSAMMQRASTAFKAISGGDYDGLATQADKGEEFLIANAATGGSKLARDLSKGTRFQLYLALRMAGYHEIAATREPLPFIADDIMETFDDGRARNAFGLMADMARVGQVIYLTHHEHLCTIAREACPQVTVHTL